MTIAYIHDMEKTSADELRVATGRLNVAASKVVRSPHEKIKKKAIAAIEKACRELDALSEYKPPSKRKSKIEARTRREIIEDWRVGC